MRYIGLFSITFLNNFHSSISTVYVVTLFEKLIVKASMAYQGLIQVVGNKQIFRNTNPNPILCSV